MIASASASGGGGGGGGSLTNVTTGVGSSATPRQSYSWWGWQQTPYTFGAQFSPDSAIGSSTPTNPSIHGYQLSGVYAGDGGSGTSNAYTYNVVVAGSAPTGTVNSLTVAGTTISNFTLTTIVTYQPYYTIFRFGMNSPATELFGTSGTVTCTIS